MPVYLNAVVMLAITLAAFIALAKIVQAVRSRRLSILGAGGRLRLPPASLPLSVEQTCIIDGKRRLLLVRCESQHVVLLTGGPNDLVVLRLPLSQAVEQAA